MLEKAWGTGRRFVQSCATPDHARKRALSARITQFWWKARHVAGDCIDSDGRRLEGLQKLGRPASPHVGQLPALCRLSLQGYVGVK